MMDDIGLCSKVLNAYEFERHAGCKTKHPNNHIFFENGKTIYQIVQELRSTPESLLFDTIQTVFGAPINQKSFRIWKGNEMCFELLRSFFCLQHFHLPVSCFLGIQSACVCVLGRYITAAVLILCTLFFFFLIFSTLRIISSSNS